VHVDWLFAELKVPAAHCWQADWAVAALKVPGRHEAQVELPLWA
jgi:hypothetical protein